MRKYPSDVSVSKKCTDANLEMVERRNPDNFPRFPPQEWCTWAKPEIALNNGIHLLHIIKSILCYEGEAHDMDLKLNITKCFFLSLEHLDFRTCNLMTLL